MLRSRIGILAAFSVMTVGLLLPVESSAGLFKRRACKPKCCAAAPAPTTTPCGTLAPAGGTPVPANGTYETPPAPTPPQENGAK